MISAGIPAIYVELGGLRSDLALPHGLPRLIFATESFS